jgi:molybdopterin/thiamine biosynthesis adenylyltransferase
VSVIAYSRPAAIAAQLGDGAGDTHRFLDKHILLTGDRAVLETENGHECLLSSLRLSLRICRNVHVALPQDLARLREHCARISKRLEFGGPVEILSEGNGYTGYDAILSVGSKTRPELPWTTINSNGWLARVSSGPTSISSEVRQTNPVGALAAASLGVSEVFKRLIALHPDRGHLLDGVTLSLETYQADSSSPGTPIGERLELPPLLIVGAGAIGNAVVYLLSRLPLFGKITILDRQRFGPENLGTCILIGPDDVGKSKATFAEEFLQSEQLEVHGFEEDLATFRSRRGPALWCPGVIIGGVDNIDARHEMQRLWPDVILDGAIGDLSGQVSRHPWDENVACLMCLFPHGVGKSAERAASEATGLSIEQLKDPDELLSEEELVIASPEAQEWLRTQIGKPKCSIIGEATTRGLASGRMRTGFAPSIPFVATLSASMVVGELVKLCCGRRTNLSPRYQVDLLRGPRFGVEFPQERRPDCICSTRRKNIEIARRGERA